jgi:hypothetical protein
MQKTSSGLRAKELKKGAMHVKRLKGEAKEVKFYKKHCPWTHWYEFLGRNTETAPESFIYEG